VSDLFVDDKSLIVLNCHCFWTLEIRSAMPSVFKTCGEASSIANGS